jgi:hypothetical protein
MVLAATYVLFLPASHSISCKLHEMLLPVLTVSSRWCLLSDCFMAEEFIPEMLLLAFAVAVMVLAISLISKR